MPPVDIDPCSGREQYHRQYLQNLKSPNLFIKDAFIDGAWISKTASFDVYEPATGTVLGQVANCDVNDFRTAIASASAAQKEYYYNTTGTERGELLRKWHDLIIQNQDDIATLLCLENGKTFAEAKGEVVYAANFVSWFAEEATRSYGVTIPSSYKHTTLSTVREPVGVCGIITPWNFPAAMITRKVAPALAAGCSVVIKPPSETPYTCLALTKLAVDAGLPPKVIQACPTKDKKAATELATNPLVRKISFTGSTKVGKMLAELAAGTLKKVSLELGGNAPVIIFEDADLDLAVEGTMFSKFRCSGQTCVCANRIYVHSSIRESFVKKLIAKTRELHIGPGMDSTTTQGPLVNKAAVNKVNEHIKDAVSKGARIEYTSKPPGNSTGFYAPPTILSGVTSSMLVARDETFGPLAPIFEFKNEEEAIQLANDTEFGLAGYLFTRSIGKASRVAQRLQVGMVGVNTGKISAVEAPFGGVKESGYGREGSLYGLDEYQTIKSITVGNLDK
ncbi:uncharacterized protein PV09_08959 [Verruconis gallopava]|uniref:Succinate-semialdehyde dehydrogenase, mitochondrial n=1 Tax=Verruconis gallopava TaxID=253628 RepID=A0A0D1YF92_9PEZI|nr:uncharacterized protein PV09_08959 [Verruconis gallopava]KIV99421.1 hypothetical protein PV09_08959 [Verruconis gallopava]